MSYLVEWFPAVCVAFVALLCAPPLVLIAFGILVIVALSALLALAAAIAATPYLLFRFVRARWAQPVLIRNADNPA